MMKMSQYFNKCWFILLIDVCEYVKCLKRRIGYNILYFCLIQIGSGAIVVQLNQPYFLSSLRLLLWDIDHRVYTCVRNVLLRGGGRNHPIFQQFSGWSCGEGIPCMQKPSMQTYRLASINTTVFKNKKNYFPRTSLNLNKGQKCVTG